MLIAIIYIAFIPFKIHAFHPFYLKYKKDKYNTTNQDILFQIQAFVSNLHTQKIKATTGKKKILQVSFALINITPKKLLSIIFWCAQSTKS